MKGQPMPLDKLEPVADVSRLEAEPGNGNGVNIRRVVRENIPGELARLQKERDEIVLRLRTVCAEITELQVHQLVQGAE